MIAPVRRVARLTGVAVVAVALLGQVGCADDEPGEGEAHLEVDGTAVVERDGERETVDDSTDLSPGDRVEVTEGVARLQLRDGVRMELRGSVGDADRSVLVMAAVPVLEAGDLLVAAPEETTVEAAGSAISVRSGSAKVSRRLGFGVAAYDAAVHIDSAGQEREVPALRQMQVPALGRPPRAPRPLDYDGQDPWDRRFLGSSIDLGRRLEAMADGYTANLPVEEASDPGFFARVLPGLSGVVELVDLVAPDRPTGETLIGAAIADLSRGGSFRERWSEVFEFRDAGAEWGLVALDQQVSPDPLLGAVESAIASTPLTFVSDVAPPPAATPPGSSSSDGGSPGTSPGTSPTSPSSTPSTPSTSRPPGTTSPPTNPTTTDPPPTLPLPDPPQLTPVIEPVTEIVGGLLGGLLNPGEG